MEIPKAWEQAMLVVFPGQDKWRFRLQRVGGHKPLPTPTPVPDQP